MNYMHPAKWDFFIAHAGTNKDKAEELFGYLDPEAKVFLDSKRLLLGDNWDAVLTGEQQLSLITVVLVSADTQRAYYEREEIAAAISMARRDEAIHRVIPIYLDDPDQPDSQIPYGLRLKQGITISSSLTLRDAARLILEQLPNLKVAMAAADASISRSQSGVSPADPVAGKPARFAPSYSFQKVNRRLVQSVLLQSLVVVGLALLARLLWSHPEMIGAIGLSVNNREVPEVLNRAIWYGVAGVLSLLLIWMQWTDVQFMFSLGRVLLFVSVLGLLCAAVGCAPGISPWVHGLLLSAFVVVGSIYYFGFGIARYYLIMRSYGDLAGEGLIFIVFVYSMRRPIMMLFERS